MSPVTEPLQSRTVLHDWLQYQWYHAGSPHSFLLPLEHIFRRAVAIRQKAYRRGYRKTVRLPVPVIVVGNLTVGGVGKTPLVIWLAQELSRKGLKPGIVSRGYGGKHLKTPVSVSASSDPAEVGDEPVLMARRAGCPVVVGKRRAEAGQHLLNTTACNVLIADDGLQHYALARDIEIAVVDGLRHFGNGHLLPAGPLREPPERLDDVEWVVYSETGPDGATIMAMRGDEAVNLADPSLRRPLADFAGQKTYAVAGIGHPARFFRHLESQGLRPDVQSLPDHHVYQPEDLARPHDWPLFMTEKDAVKCSRWADARCWYVPVEACLPPGSADSIYQLIQGKM